MQPVFVLAGQSNAGSMLKTGLFSELTSSSSATILSFVEGSTSLAPLAGKNDWYPIEDGDPKTGELYENMRLGIEAALAGSNRYLAGIVWVQGEADAYNTSASSYKANLTALVERLRSDFGTDFKMSIVQLASSTPEAQNPARTTGWNVVRDAQAQVAHETGVAVLDPDSLVATDGFSNADLFRDPIHYSFQFAEVLLRAALSQVDPNGALAVSAPLIGTGGADTLIGTRVSDTIMGGNGNDLLVGGDGNDRLAGGAGDDAMNGGLGDDVFVIDTAGDTVIERSSGGSDTALIYSSWRASAHVESLNAGQASAAVNLVGNAIDNAITGSAHSDRLNGAHGNDTINGSLGNDTLVGGFGKDWLGGGLGNDVLSGGPDGDLVYGNAGDDTLFGGMDDNLFGGSGNDFFHFGAGFKKAVIYDLNVGSADRVVFAGYTVESFKLAQAGTNVILTVGQDLLYLRNTQVGDVDTDSFAFV